MLEPNLSFENCETRSQYIFIGACNKTVEMLRIDYFDAAAEYGACKQDYDNINWEYNNIPFIKEKNDSTEREYLLGQSKLLTVLHKLSCFDILRQDKLVPDQRLESLNKDNNQIIVSDNKFIDVKSIMSEYGFLFRYGDSNIVESDVAYKYLSGDINQKPDSDAELVYLKNPSMSDNLRRGYLENLNYRLDKMNTSEDIYRVVLQGPRKDVQFIPFYAPGSSLEHPIQDELPPIKPPIVQRMQSEEILARAAEARRQIQADQIAARDSRHNSDSFLVVEPQHSRMLP